MSVELSDQTMESSSNSQRDEVYLKVSNPSPLSPSGFDTPTDNTRNFSFNYDNLKTFGNESCEIKAEGDSIYKEERKVGQMYAFLYRDGVPLIVIGPHWKFFAGMSGFILIAMVLYFYYLFSRSHIIFKYVIPISYFVQFTSYTYTALINPGIRSKYIKNTETRVVKQNEGEIVKNYTVCSKCDIFSYQDEGVQHCYSCEVCVEGRDHHCPWTTKCVGKRNLISFYIFVGSSCILMTCVYIGLFTSLFPTK